MKRQFLTILFAIVTVMFSLNAAPKQLDSIVNKEIKIIKTDNSQDVKDSIIYSKLSAEQLLELKKQEGIVEMERIEAESKEDMPLNGLGIVIISIMPFFFVLLLIWIIGREKRKESVRKHELYKLSMEMGKSLPDNFFEEPAKKSFSSNLKRGILWLAVGLAILIYFIIVHNNKALIAGIIPTFVGVGYLLVHFLDKPKNDEQNG